MKKTIQEHKGDLEAAEAACAELDVKEEILPSTSSKPKKRQLHSDTEILQSLQKRVEESGNVLKRYYQGSTTVHFIQVSICQLRQRQHTDDVQDQV